MEGGETGDVYESTPQKSTADERWSGVESRRAAGGAGRVTKVVVLGNAAVGKTSMIRRFAKGDFVDKYRSTIGADFLSKAVNVKDPKGRIATSTNVVLQIWDTCGQERFRALSSVFFRGADACVLVCSVDDRSTLLSGIPEWFTEFSGKCTASACVVLAISKIDISEWQFTKEEVQSVSASLGISNVQYVSSLTGDGIDQLFAFVASEIVRSGQEQPQNSVPSFTVSMVHPQPRVLAASGSSPQTDGKFRECVCRPC